MAWARSVATGVESAHVVKTIWDGFQGQHRPYPSGSKNGPTLTKMRLLLPDIVGMDRHGGLWVIGEPPRAAVLTQKTAGPP
jgi:hypothetical protein